MKVESRHISPASLRVSMPDVEELGVETMFRGLSTLERGLKSYDSRYC